MIPSDDAAETWEERREPRGFFGKLAKFSFVVFNLWAAFELVNVFIKLEALRAENKGNGFAQLGINLAANNRLTEMFIWWAVIGAVLGIWMMGTRGKKVIVKRGART